MSAYAETQFENKAICLSLWAKGMSTGRTTKNNDECTGMKLACTLMPMMISDFAGFFPKERKCKSRGRMNGSVLSAHFVSRISEYSDQNLDWTPVAYSSDEREKHPFSILFDFLHIFRMLQYLNILVTGINNDPYSEHAYNDVATLTSRDVNALISAHIQNVMTATFC